MHCPWLWSRAGNADLVGCEGISWRCTSSTILYAFSCVMHYTVLLFSFTSESVYKPPTTLQVQHLYQAMCSSWESHCVCTAGTVGRYTGRKRKWVGLVCLCGVLCVCVFVVEDVFFPYTVCVCLLCCYQVSLQCLEGFLCLFHCVRHLHDAASKDALKFW